MTRLIQEYVTRQAERSPDAPALVLGEERLTYGQLEEESNRLARLLAESGCRRGDRVSIFQPKTPAAIVSMLATLKADCAYVPIDVASPAPRVAKIIDAAEPRVILVDPSSAALLDATLGESELAQAPLVGSVGAGPLEGERFASRFSPADWSAYDAGPVETANGPDDIAHLLFTSGSTGTPKGVMIKHENVVTFVEWATGYFGTKETDRISGHPPLHFDLSTFDIYGTFLAGAELHLVPASLNLIPQKLAEFIRSSELTQWFAVPSIFTFMAKFEAVDQDDFPTVERVLWCGEVLPTPVLVHWMKRVPHATFTNLYGPTEATIASSYYTMPGLPPSETDPIPIGVACAGEELLVLDSELKPVADGEIGDLYIAGVGLSPGYWRDEEKTSAAFLEEPRDSRARIYKTGDLARMTPDGLFHFLGRADSQIKSRGYRIELGEIETALSALSDLGESAVVGVDVGGFEGTAICCAYAPAAGADVQPADVRRRLQTVLPTYMLPSRWHVMDVLPKNVNGKIDRRRLREHFEQEAANESPAAERVAP
jgi:amino acid adenylation domain-containing protein